MKTKNTKELRKQVKELKDKGYSEALIANELQIPVNVVRQVNRRNKRIQGE